MKDEKELKDTFDDKIEGVKDVLGDLLKSMDSLGGGNKDLEFFKLMMLQQSQFYQTLLNQQAQEIRAIREEIRDSGGGSMGAFSRQMETFMKLAEQFRDKGGKSDLTDKLIDAASPHIGDVLKTFGAVAGLGVRKLKGLPVNPNSPQPAVPPSSPQALPEQPTVPEVPPQFRLLFDVLHGYIQAHDTARFPEIGRQLVEIFGDSIMDQISSGQVSQELLVNSLQVYGGPKFQDTNFLPAMNRYIEGFIRWVQSVHKTQPTPQPAKEIFTTHCSICGDLVDFENEQVFLEEENPICGALMDDGVTKCQGRLVPGEPPDGDTGKPPVH